MQVRIQEIKSGVVRYMDKKYADIFVMGKAAIYYPEKQTRALKAAVAKKDKKEHSAEKKKVGRKSNVYKTRVMTPEA